MVEPRRAYVLGYREKSTPKPPPSQQRPFTKIETVEVSYSDTPNWRMLSLEEAEDECRILCQMQVHVGDHYCHFVVEQLGEYSFAIYCTTHPEHLKLDELSRP